MGGMKRLELSSTSLLYFPRPPRRRMIGGFLLFSSAMEVLEGLVALLVCYHALKFYKLAGGKQLFSLFTAFLILGVGLMGHGLTTGLVIFYLARLKAFFVLLALRVSALALFVCECASYGILAYSYTKGPGETGAAPGKAQLTALSAWLAWPLATAIGQRSIKPEVLVALMRPHPLFEAVVLALLAYLSFRTTSHFLSERDLNPFLVCFGFLFLTAARACFLLSHALAALFITGHLLQLLAFLSILLVVLRVISA